MTIQLRRENGKKVIGKIKIHNIYNPSPALITSENPSSLPLVQQEIQEPGEHLLLGDFNLHHPNWNNPNRYSYHKEADTLVELTEDRGMELISPHNKPTWNARGHESVIDLVFATLGVKEAVNNCGTHQEFRYGSDHIPIYTELDLSVEERTSRARRAWKTADPEKVAREAEVLNAFLSTEPISTTEEADVYLDKMLEDLKSIIENTVPWAKPSTKVKTFWGPECRAATDKAQARAREYRKSRSDRTEKAWKDSIRERNRIFKKAKALHFRKSVHESAESKKGIWNLAKWAKDRSQEPKPLPKFPSLKKRSGELASKFEDKVTVLRETFFPPPSPAEVDDLKEAVYSHPIQIDETVTKKRFERLYSDSKQIKHQA